MLGQSLSMLLPRVVGVRLHGALPEGATATDLVLTITEMLRRARRGREVRRVLRARRRRDRRSPDRRHHRQHEPRVRLDLRVLPDRRRDAALPARSPAGPHETVDAGRGLRQAAGPLARPGRVPDATPSSSSSTCHGGAVAGRAAPAPGPGAAPSAALPHALPNPRCRDDVTPADEARESFRSDRRIDRRPGPAASRVRARRRHVDGRTRIDHGAVAIAAITSCTNTSNPSVMVAAGLLAKNAVERGLRSQAVGQDQPLAGIPGGHRLPRRRRPHAVPREARLPPRRLRLHDLHRRLRPADRRGHRGRHEHDLSRGRRCCPGNRNFDGRINPDVRMNYLASPPLVVAYALAGTMDIDLRRREPLGTDADGHPVLPRATSGRPPARSRTSSTPRVDAEHVHPSLRRRVRRRRPLASPRRAHRRAPSPGTTTPPTCAARRTSTA